MTLQEERDRLLTLIQKVDKMQTARKRRHAWLVNSTNGTYCVGLYSFKEGDIVEKHDGTWKYWTTIQSQSDAEAAYRLHTAFYRVVRGPEKMRVY
jgi:hypothetical protein